MLAIWIKVIQQLGIDLVCVKNTTNRQIRGKNKNYDFIL